MNEKLKNGLTRFFNKYWIGIIIIIASILLDAITKAIIINFFEETVQYKEEELEIINGFFYITYTINTGAGWSMLSDKTWLLIIITFIALGVFIFLMKDFDIKKHRFYSIGISLMLGGTIGNLIERVFKGGVTDFLDFIIFGYDYPVFNVADMCLVAGAIALLVSLLLTKENVFEEKKNPLAHQEDTETAETSDKSLEEKNKEKEEINE